MKKKTTTFFLKPLLKIYNGEGTEINFNLSYVSWIPPVIDAYYWFQPHKLIKSSSRGLKN
jgi:hypothetical protein